MAIFGLITERYLESRLLTLRKELDEGRIDEAAVQKVIDANFSAIALEWQLWQRKFLNLVATLSKKAKKAAEAEADEGVPEESLHDAPGRGNGDPPAPDYPPHPRRHLRGF